MTSRRVRSSRGKEHGKRLFVLAANFFLDFKNIVTYGSMILETNRNHGVMINCF